MKCNNFLTRVEDIINELENMGEDEKKILYKIISNEIDLPAIDDNNAYSRFITLIRSEL